MRGAISGALWLMGLAASMGACGDDTAETEQAVLPTGCSEWCTKAAECAGVEQSACEQQCASEFPGDGDCAEQAAAARSCYATEWNATCEPPTQCLDAVRDYASCTGLGCSPENGICGEDAVHGYDCRCAGGCGSPWQFQANCTTQGSQTYCDCFLSGPIGPVGDIATVQTTCSGDAGDADACQDHWGCCRLRLLQIP